MDRLKGVAKGGWHPSGDRAIHRDTWKSDLKGMATGKKNDPNEAARNHTSAPLATLKDPDSFGPPPKHSAYYGTQSQTQSPTQSSATRPTAQGGLGAQAPAPQQKQQERETEPAKPSVPYRSDTTGLRTDNLPKPPTRAATGGLSSPASASASPVVPPRQPPRQTTSQARPPPILPPRQNEHPDEHTPAPPPPYEATPTSFAKSHAAVIDQNASQRLGQAGISVPALGIGKSTNASDAQAPVRGPQLSELNQRFAQMNTKPAGNISSPTTPTGLAASGLKKAAPPPPPKKASLASEPSTSSQGSGPPPIPLGSKPRA